MQIIKKFLSADKKSSENNTVVAIAVALVTALAGSGLIFGFFDNDNYSRNAGSRHLPANPPGFITAKTRVPVVDLNGKWHFSIGDNPDWARPEFDDSSWQQIAVPSQWEKKGVKDYDGFAWYRHSFSIEPENTEKPIYAFLGQIDDVDEVFVNGHRIGGMGTFPPNFTTAWNLNRVYRVANDILHAGANNVISVRVYDDRMGGGIHRGNIGLFTTELIQPLVYLDGPWKFKTGDDPDWKEPNFDDSSFASIHVPLEWGLGGYENYDGYAWYRKSFGSVPEMGSEKRVLLLGKIDDTDEVFLNGELIGTTGTPNSKNDPEYDSYYRTVREYVFPASLLRSENQIAIRVHDSGDHGGIYSGPVGIMTQESYTHFQDQLEEAEKWHLSDTVDWLLGRK